MKKKITVILITSLLLVISFSVISVNAADDDQQESSSNDQTPITCLPYIECHVTEPWPGGDMAPYEIPFAKLELFGDDGSHKIKWTNLRGRCTFWGCSLDVTYTITASHQDYISKTETVEIPAEDGYEDVLFELESVDVQLLTIYGNDLSTTSAITSSDTISLSTISSNNPFQQNS